MPVISYFFGIYIRMYFDDHGAPHFHAVYQGSEAFVSIETGDILEGRLPTKAARLVKEWTLAHQPELMQNWWRGQALEPMQRIPGGDSD
jgi:Domain of unknown function (DUF4160)